MYIYIYTSSTKNLTYCIYTHSCSNSYLCVCIYIYIYIPQVQKCEVLLLPIFVFWNLYPLVEVLPIHVSRFYMALNSNLSLLTSHLGSEFCSLTSTKRIPTPLSAKVGSESKRSIQRHSQRGKIVMDKKTKRHTKRQKDIH